MSYRMQRRVAALAGTVAVITSVAGVGVAAAKSLPGDPFYGVKRATENVQLFLAQGQEAKGKKHLEFARTRLSELQKLSPTSSHVASTLAAMNAQTADGSADLISAYQSSHSTTPVVDLVTFTEQQARGLTTLATKLPASLRPVEVKSVTVLAGVVSTLHQTTGNVCLTCLTSGHVLTPTSTSHPSGGGTTSTPNPAPSKSAHPSPHPHRTPTSTPTRSTAPATSSTPSTSTTPAPNPIKSLLSPHPLKSLLPGLLNPKHKKLKPIPLISSLVSGLGL